MIMMLTCFYTIAEKEFYGRNFYYESKVILSIQTCQHENNIPDALEDPVMSYEELGSCHMS